MVTTAQRRDIDSRLLGKVLRRSQNQFDRSGNGSSFFERNEALYLFEDHSFRYERSTQSSVSAGGLSLGGGPRVERAEGTWWIRSDGTQPFLELKHADGSLFAAWPVRVPRVEHLEYVSGEPWNRYVIRKD